MSVNQNNFDSSSLPDRVLRPGEQCAFLGIGRTKLHLLERNDPTFPQKIELGGRACGRLMSELMAWALSKRGGQR